MLCPGICLTSNDKGEQDTFGLACLMKTWKQEDEIENNVTLKIYLLNTRTETSWMIFVTFQDLQGSVVDPGRILQHQGRHPERDDGSTQVFGRGTFVHYPQNFHAMRAHLRVLTQQELSCISDVCVPAWTDPDCRK